MPSFDTDLMIYALLGLIVILSLWIIRLESRISKLMRGKSGKSLEDTVNNISQEINDLEKFRDDSIEYFKQVEFRLKRSVQATETLRFNPFKGNGSGGNQSFSTAMLNEKGDGVVMTSLYARDRVSIFSKPIKKFSSDFELTEEETLVINTAKNSLSLQKEILK